MNSGTSLFNKSIIKSDFRRLWWVSALNTLFIFLTLTLNIINDYLYRDIDTAVKFSYSTVARYSGAMWIFSLIFPVVLGVLLFSYMQSGRASTFAHSIPVTRKGLYLSHIFSGIIMLIIPILINTIILVLLKLNPDFKNVYHLSHIFTSMSVALIYSLIAFSLATFTSFVMGNTVASFIFTYVFGVLPAAVQVFITYFSEQQLYGYHYGGGFEFLNTIYIGPYQVTELKSVLLYGILTLAFLILGFFIYKIRNIENHSEIVGFPKLRHVFVLGAGLTTGCIGYCYFNEIFRMQNILFLIPFGVLGIIIAKMIVKKSLWVPECYKQIIAFTLFTFCLYGIFTYDLTGYENRIPELSEIASVKFGQDINVVYTSDMDTYGEVVEPKYTHSPILTDEKDIEKVIKLHTELVANRYDDKNYYSDLTDITYTLKNGKTIKRTYNIEPEQYLSYLAPVAETTSVRQTYFPILREDNRIITELEIHDERIPVTLYKSIFHNEPELIEELTIALKKDLTSAKGEEFAKREHTFTYIQVKYKLPAIYVNKAENNSVPESKLREHSETYYIRNSYKNTIELLKKYGLYDVLPKAEDIKMVGIEFYDLGYDPKETTEIDVSDRTFYFHKTFENAEDIKKIYEYAASVGFPVRNSNASLTFITKDHTFSIPFNTLSTLPEILK